MNDPKYKLGDRVEIESFGAQDENEQETIVDINEKENGDVDYTIKTERPRYEKRWEDEIIGEV